MKTAARNVYMLVHAVVELFNSEQQVVKWVFKKLSSYSRLSSHFLARSTLKLDVQQLHSQIRTSHAGKPADQSTKGRKGSAFKHVCIYF